VHFPPATRTAQIALHRVSSNALGAKEDLCNKNKCLIDIYGNKSLENAYIIALYIRHTNFSAQACF